MSAYSQKLATYGQWTYRGAWALEIAAATIGLATGLALGIQAFNASQTATAMDLTLASAPFLMVAIAELTKIPIATLLFSASWLWKPLLLVLLMALAVITFETVFMGLERAGTLRQLRYEELASKVRVDEQEANRLAEVNRELRANDYEAIAFAEFQRVTDRAEKERAQVREQISTIDKEMETGGSLSAEAIRLRNQLQDRETARTELLARRDKEIAAAVEQFERQRESFVERIRIATAANNRESIRRNEEELARLQNPRPAIIARFDSDITAVDQNIASLRGQFDAARDANATAVDAQRAQQVVRRQKAEELLSATESRWAPQLAAAQERHSNAQRIEANKSTTLVENENRIGELRARFERVE